MEWEVHLEGYTAQGLWSPREARMHINIVELWAVHLACKVFLLLLESRHIELLSYNMTARVYVNKQGSV